MTRLTRQELYDLAWDRPMTKLAKEFGLSDVALHKICKKNDVPTPPAGYWAKLAHGKKATKTALPKVEEELPIIVRGGQGSGETEETAVARAGITKKLKFVDAANLPGTTHPLIDKSIAALQKRRPSRSTGLVSIDAAGFIPMEMHPDQIPRAKAVLEKMHALGDELGITLGRCEGKVAWLLDGTPVFFGMFEVPDKVEHEPTEKELRALAKWEAESEERRQKFGWQFDYGRPHIPKWEEQYNGRLSLQLEEVRDRSGSSYWGPAIRAKFSDTKTRDVMNMGPRIMSTIAAIAAAKIANDEADERRERERVEAEARRAEQARRAEYERQRDQVLDQMLEELSQVEQLERYTSRLAKRVDAGGASNATVRLLDYARTRLENRQQNLAGSKLDERLAGTVFGEEAG